MENTDDAPSSPAFLEAADEFRKSFEPNTLSARPSRHIVVVTCMDARLDLFRLLGLQIGDSHILRNAGGRVTDDVIRSLVLSSHALGTREVVVIHHTGCGLFGATNEDLRDKVLEATGWTADHIDFLPFRDVVASVQQDVEKVRDCSLLPDGMTAWGCVYDVDDGSLTRVV
jgi:carbonic anhydrase